MRQSLLLNLEMTLLKQEEEEVLEVSWLKLYQD